MADQTADRRIDKIREVYADEVDAAASVEYFRGEGIGVDSSGNAVKPGATLVRSIGVVRAHTDNSSGSAADVTVPYMTGIFAFANDGGSTITKVHRGADVYWADSQTVAAADQSAGTAGKFMGFNHDGLCLVQVGV